MRSKYLMRLTAILVLASALQSYCASQQSAPATTPDPTAQTQPPPTTVKTGDSSSAQEPANKGNKDATTKSQSAGPGTSNDRLFFTLPNFLTLENSGKVPPLTSKQKFAVVVRGSFDYVQYPWYAFLSGVSQAENSEPGFGQGWEGYGKRFGSALADGTIENFMTGAILPSMLHQDPRYFQSGHGSFTHRSFYAMSRNLITRGDSGKNEFNYSEVVGGALSAAISTYSYHPKGRYVTTTTPGVLHYISSDRTLANTGKVWATQYGYDTMTLVVKEFWPDIRRKIRKTPKSQPGISLQQQQ
ncbi:MAG TPA: hypothetical protein VJP02_07565 [Candidatus Sulfotelmatobacter sp.]|nr:hypothetical protein [Candidatus Sulfotelmatobacter sp.]